MIEHRKERGVTVISRQLDCGKAASRSPTASQIHVRGYTDILKIELFCNCWHRRKVSIQKSKKPL